MAQPFDPSLVQNFQISSGGNFTFSYGGKTYSANINDGPNTQVVIQNTLAKQGIVSSPNTSGATPPTSTTSQPTATEPSGTTQDVPTRISGPDSYGRYTVYDSQHPNGALYAANDPIVKDYLSSQLNASIQNLPNLGPGSTGGDVQKLQTWLVANGFMTQAQMDTGPGIYGNQTKAAVAAWQQANNIDTQGNPGYFGPISKAFLQENPSGSTSGGTTSTPYTGGMTTKGDTTTQGGVSYDSSWSTYGITSDVWGKLNPTQQGVIAASLSAARGLYGANASNVTLQKALAAAATDPTITAKYADALKIEQASLQQQLSTLQTTTTLTAQQQQQQFEQERRALAEQSAAAGQAYSGFRGKAQEQLGQQEAGIITSSRAQTQQALTDLSQQFEAKYGTSATPFSTIQANLPNPYLSSIIGLGGTYQPSTGASETLTGATIGGITGTQPVEKQQEINALAANYVNLGQMPGVTPA